MHGITTPNYSTTSSGRPPKPTGNPPEWNMEDEIALCTPRPYYCPSPDVIVLCYSSVDVNSLIEVETLIWPDLRKKFPGVPIILVATKCDARDTVNHYLDNDVIWHLEGDSSKFYFKARRAEFTKRIKTSDLAKLFPW